MKLTKIIILILLAILTVGAVSAVNETDAMGFADSDVAETVSDDASEQPVLKSDGSDENLSANSDEDALSGVKVDFRYEDNSVYLDDFSYVTITLPNDVKEHSTYYFYIDGKIYKKDIVSWGGELIDIDLGKISCGKHSYKFIYSNSKNVQVKKTGTFTADWSLMELDNVYYRDEFGCCDLIEGDVYVSGIRLPEDAVGNLKAVLNGNKTYYFGPESYRHIIIPNLPVGINKIVYKYKDSKYSAEKTCTDTVRVFAKIETPKVISCMENLTFSLKLPSDAKGRLLVHVDGEDYNLSLVNGIAGLTLPVLNPGKHAIWAGYTGDDYPVKDIGNKYWDYPANEWGYESVNIGANARFPDEINYGDNEYLIFELPEDADGTLKVLIDGKNVKTDFSNGSARIPLSNLIFEYHSISLQYSSDSRYPDFDETFTVFVSYNSGDVKLELADEIFEKSATTFTFTAPKDCKGEVSLFFGAKIYTAKFKNGKATISVKTPSAGLRTAYYRFDFSRDTSPIKCSVNVLKKPVLKIQNKFSKKGTLEMFYDINDVLKFRMYDAKGKSVGANKKLTITFFHDHGKKVAAKTAKIDKNGFVKLKLNFLKVCEYAEHYDFKVTYKGAKLYENHFWHHFPAAREVINGGYNLQNNLYIIKSSKKATVKLTLSTDIFYKSKQVLKYKTLTCKFNGKTYKLKTNKKGIALLTIKKSQLKKLKVGKKYTLTTIYKNNKAIDKIIIEKK